MTRPGFFIGYDEATIMQLSRMAQGFLFGRGREGQRDNRLFHVTVTDDRSRRVSSFTWLILGGIILAVAGATLGLPPFGIPMPTWEIGVVTPTCGLTRASVALARGEPGLAWAFNPAAFLLAIVATATVVRAFVGKITGRWVDASVAASGHVWSVLIWIWWANQQLNANFVINGTL